MNDNLNVLDRLLHLNKKIDEEFALYEDLHYVAKALYFFDSHIDDFSHFGFDIDSHDRIKLILSKVIECQESTRRRIYDLKKQEEKLEYERDFG